MNLASIDRKDSHLSICLERDVESCSGTANGFGAYRFEHDALPEIDFPAIRLETTLFGKKLAAPLVIGAMTGGTERAGEINRRIAVAAERCQVALALGSQRKMLREDGGSAVADTYAVRKTAPGIPLLFGNLGAVQLNYGVRPGDIRRLIKELGCEAFNFHLNPLQEAIQPEGDRDFSGLMSKLRDCIPELGVPVVIKEVGSGISAATARKLGRLPIQGVETAGAGGTSWARIEGMRSANPEGERLGELFSDWGVPTADSIIACRTELPRHVVIASGGIRNGIEAAKAIALGADAVAIALPILRAAERSADHATSAIEAFVRELKTAMFATGMSSIEELRRRGGTQLRRTHSWKP